MAKQENKEVEIDLVALGKELSAMFYQVHHVADGALRVELVNRAIAAKPTNADDLDKLFCDTLVEFGLVQLTACNARLTAENVIIAPQPDTMNKERWLQLSRLHSACQLPDNTVAVIGPRAYFADKFVGYTAVNKASTPKFASLTK